MDILTYTAEQQDFRARLHAFCENGIAPFADQWECDHGVPREIWRRMGRAGFLCPCVDPAYGGLGGDFRYALIVGEEGNLERTPIVRGLRDARIMSIFAGTNEIMKQIAAKFMGL